MSELKPCPFCGVTLTANNNPADLYVQRYGTHYSHPDGHCYLSGDEVSPSRIEDWNTRAAGIQNTAGDGGDGGAVLDEPQQRQRMSLAIRRHFPYSAGSDHQQMVTDFLAAAGVTAIPTTDNLDVTGEPK
jgi:hypothetical protein